MEFTFKKHYSPDIKRFKEIFAKSFSTSKRVVHVKDLGYIDKKMDAGYTGIDAFAIIAYDKDNNVAGGMGVYPVVFESNGNKYIGAQIGDAGVLPEYRKKGLFAAMINNLVNDAEVKFDLLFALPAITNIGSYKSFINTGFVEKGTLYTNKIRIKPKLFPRIIRRISKRVYNWHENAIVSSYSSKQKGLDQYIYSKGPCLFIVRNKDYIKYKNYNKNFLLDLHSDTAWIALKKFEMYLGEFYLKNSKDFKILIANLESIASRLGKDYLIFFLNNESCLITESIDSKIIKANKLCKMVYYCNNELKDKEIRITFADCDTF